MSQIGQNCTSLTNFRETSQIFWTMQNEKFTTFNFFPVGQSCTSLPNFRELHHKKINLALHFPKGTDWCRSSPIGNICNIFFSIWSKLHLVANFEGHFSPPHRVLSAEIYTYDIVFMYLIQRDSNYRIFGPIFQTILQKIKIVGNIASKIRLSENRLSYIQSEASFELRASRRVE